VLGGKLFTFLQKDLGRIHENVSSRVYQFVKHRVRIEQATFGESQSAVGAAALIFDNLLAKPLQTMNR